MEPNASNNAEKKEEDFKKAKEEIEKEFYAAKERVARVRAEEEAKRADIDKNLSNFKQAIDAREKEVEAEQAQRHSERMSEIENLADQISTAAKKMDTQQVLDLLNNLSKK